MIRIWNYNKSRIHSFRGVKDIKITFDNRMIFIGEIRKAPGTIKNAEHFCEYIMFTDEEEILKSIEQKDWLNNIKLNDEDNVKEFIRPKTTTKKDLEEFNEYLKIEEKSILKGPDGRPLTSANFQNAFKYIQILNFNLNHYY